MGSIAPEQIKKDRQQYERSIVHQRSSVQTRLGRVLLCHERSGKRYKDDQQQEQQIERHEYRVRVSDMGKEPVMFNHHPPPINLEPLQKVTRELAKLLGITLPLV